MSARARVPRAGRRTEGVAYERVGRRYWAPLLVRRFPVEVPFGFLGRVLPTTETTELSFEAYPIAPDRALTLLEGARAVAEAELGTGGANGQTPQLEAERSSAEELGRLVARRLQELWKVGLCLAANATTRPRAEASRARLAERLAALGFRSRVPRYAVHDALAPSDLTAAGPRPAGYWQTLSTDGLAALFPFGDESVLEPGGVLVGLALADASPVFLDRWSQPSHSWGIFGTTGAGKSFATALVSLRNRWLVPECDLIVLDPLGEFDGFVGSLGGSVVRLADGDPGRLNPLDPVTAGNDRREKAARVGAMLRALFPSLRDEEVAALDAAVSRLYERGPDVPTFDDLLREVERENETGDRRLAGLLGVFASGSLRGVNGPTTLRLNEGPVDVDFRGVSESELPFHLTYVLDWAYGRLRSRPGPKLLVIDEAHLLARHPATAEFLDRIVRHIRHYRAGVVVVSQSPDDFLGHPSGRSLLRNLHATAFLRLREVSPEARAFFGLTRAECEWLPNARLPREAGYSESLWRIGELHLPLAIVASTPEYEFLDRTLGTPPADPA